MAKKQEDFRRHFKEVFGKQYKDPITWHEGQTKENKLPLSKHIALRRGGVTQPNEDLEFGDLRANLGSHTLIVEHESGAVSVHNLTKYWPYIRGELVIRPELPILLCHFSDWSSFGSHRDLWQWMQAQMASDPHRGVNFWGRQFDYGGKRKSDRESPIKEATSWVLSHCT